MRLWLLALVGGCVVAPGASTSSLDETGDGIATGEIEVFVDGWLEVGTDVQLVIDAPLDGLVPIEVVWTTRDIEALDVSFEGGKGVAVLSLPDPCTTLLEAQVFAVVRAPDLSWSAVLDVAIEGAVRGVHDGSGAVSLGRQRTALCGDAAVVSLWLLEAGGYRIEQYDSPGFVLRAGEASANPASEMALPAGEVRFEALDKVEQPYTIVIDAI